MLRPTWVESKILVTKFCIHILGWFTYWKPERPFPLDMAGFAINLQLFFLHPDVKFALRVRRGYQESVLLQQLVTQDQLEPLADACSKVTLGFTYYKGE